MGQLGTPIIRELPGAFRQQPAASGTATATLSPGRTYAKILMLFTVAGVAASRAQIAAQLARIRVTVSGEEIMNGTGAELLAIQAYDSQTDSPALWPGFLSLDFMLGWLRSYADGEAGMLGTADQGAVEIETQWAAGATINGAALYAAMDPMPQPAGAVRRFVRVNPTVSALGAFDFPDLPKPRNGESLNALHLFVPVVANLTRMAYLADDVFVYDGPREVMNRIAVEAGSPRSPQDANGCVSLDFTAFRGLSGDAIDMSKVASHVLRMTFANATPGTFPIQCELIRRIAPGIGAGQQGA